MLLASLVEVGPCVQTIHQTFMVRVAGLEPAQLLPTKRWQHRCTAQVRYKFPSPHEPSPNLKDDTLPHGISQESLPFDFAYGVIFTESAGFASQLTSGSYRKPTFEAGPADIPIGRHQIPVSPHLPPRCGHVGRAIRLQHVLYGVEYMIFGLAIHIVRVFG
jgi:hypothetical protein